ncbi:MAG: DUF3298 and DUF4163 domain-containing protein [Chitinophagales bacterium]|nr:DUF3298 and DUF4163 domain-containing protein [Chitinophagales bacterium]
MGCKATYISCYVSDGLDKIVQKNINAVLIDVDISGNEANNLLTNLALDAMSDEFDNYTDDYTESFTDSISPEQQKFMDESPQMYNWSTLTQTQVLFNENYILSLRKLNYEYTGGAHGNSSFVNLVFNLHTGYPLKLDDILKPSEINQISQLENGQLRKDYNIQAGHALTDAGFLIDKVESNNNFFITKSGLGFTYNPYEIAPYVFGSVNVIIPWNQLQPLINPNGPLAWAIKK